jgi:hypothetical protein
LLFFLALFVFSLFFLALPMELELECRIFVFKSNEAGNAFWKKSGWETRDDLTTYSKDV